MIEKVNSLHLRSLKHQYFSLSKFLKNIYNIYEKNQEIKTYNSKFWTQIASTGLMYPTHTELLLNLYIICLYLCLFAGTMCLIHWYYVPGGTPLVVICAW